MSQALGINIAKLLSSKVAAQFLMLVTTPLITRLFLPEHFGAMQIFESIGMPLFIIACLKYEQAIPLSKTPQEASASLVLCLFFTCVVSGCSVIGVLLGRFQLAAWFRMPELSGFLWLLPAFVFIFGLNMTLNSWAAHEGQFGIMAFAGLGETLCDKVLVLFWGFLLKASAAGFLLGRFLGVLSSAAVLLYSQGNTLRLHIGQAHLTFAILKRVAVQHKKFPLFSTWTSLFAVLTFQLPALFFGLYFSPAVVGYYALAHRVVSLSSIFLGPVIAQVFFPTAAQTYHETKTLAPIVRQIFLRLVQFSLFPLAVLGLFGTTLFSTVFGQQWAEAGMYAQILSAWHFLIFLNISLNIFALVNRQEFGLMLTLTGLVVRLTGIFASLSFNSPRITLGIFVFFSVIFPLGQLLWKLRISGVSNIWASNVILKYVALACALLLPAKWLSWMFNDIRVDVVVILCATGGYIGVLLLLEPFLWQFVVTMVGRFQGTILGKRS